MAGTTARRDGFRALTSATIRLRILPSIDASVGEITAPGPA
jgi:hypothetical protein